MRRRAGSPIAVPTVLLAAAVIAFALALPAPAPAANGVPGCGTRPSALKWDVIRSGSKRAVGLRYSGAAAAVAVKPIQFLLTRTKRARATTWTSLNSQYRYRARAGQQARFGIVYVEDRSGYGNTRQVDGLLGLLPLNLPVVDLPGLVNFLGGTVQKLLPSGLPVGLPNVLGIVAPQVAGGSFAPDTCLRVMRLTVAEPAKKQPRSVRRR